MVLNESITPYNVEVAYREGADVLDIIIEYGVLMPLGNNQAGIVPLGTKRFPINRDACEKLVKQIEEQIDNLPKPSNLEIAKDLAGVEEAAQSLNSLRG